MNTSPDPRLRTSMGLVLLACIPGLLTLLWLHGWGLLVNLLLCASAAILCETLLLAMRGQPPKPALSDGSALVTAILLACALPTLTPWWLPVVATSVAIGIGKQQLVDEPLARACTWPAGKPAAGVYRWSAH